MANTSMRAAVFHGSADGLLLEDVAAPHPGVNDVVVAIRACGVCGGDLQRVAGMFKTRTPRILGHEPAGIVARVGGGVTDFHPGDRVILSASGCGHCYYCRIGKDNICDIIATGSRFGVETDGAYAEYCAVPQSQLIRLPDDLSLETGSVISASTGTAFHAILESGASVGDTAVIFGAGCIGTQALQILKTMGVRTIIVDIVAERLKTARVLGAHTTLDGSVDNVVDAVRDLTGGRGADVAFEVAGSPITLLQGLACVRRGGTVVDIGSLMEPVTIPMMPFFDGGLALTREITLKTSTHYTRRDATKLLEFLEVYQIDFDEGTHKVPLEDIGEAFDAKRSGQFTRVLVIPNGEV